MPEEYQEESVVEEASVDAGQEQETSTEAGETVVTTAVDARKPENNGEAIKRELARREAILQKQYEEKYSPVTQQNAYLERMARMEGFSDVPSYLKAIDEYERKQQFQQEAQRLGVDPDTYAQHFAPVNEKANALEQKVQALESQITSREKREQAQQQWGDLYSQYPSLVESSRSFDEGKTPEWFTPQMQEFVNAGYKPVHAYELAHKETLFRQKEQETIARLTGRDQKQVLPSNDSPNNVQFDPANMSIEDINKISERVQRGERIVL